MPTTSTFGPGALPAATIASRLSRVEPRLPPRSPSLPPSSMTTIAGWCCASSAGKSRAPAGRRVAGDARVDDAMRIALLGEPRREQVDPPRAGGKSVAGRDRIADDEQHRRARVGARRQECRHARRERRQGRRGRDGGWASAGGSWDGIVAPSRDCRGWRETRRAPR